MITDQGIACRTVVGRIRFGRVILVRPAAKAAVGKAEWGLPQVAFPLLNHRGGAEGRDWFESAGERQASGGYNKTARLTEFHLQSRPNRDVRTHDHLP